VTVSREPKALSDKIAPGNEQTNTPTQNYVTVPQLAAQVSRSGLMKTIRLAHFRRYLALALAFAALASCATAPQYDATTDSDISSLQKEIDTQLVQWIVDDRLGDADSLKNASYASSTQFYAKVDTDLTALELRMEAIPDASTVKLPDFFTNLRNQLLINLKNAHQKDGHLVEPVLEVTRNQLNAQFAVLLTYELSLKGVSSPSKSSTTSTATTTAAKK
jgi:hypothetical protein